MAQKAAIGHHIPGRLRMRIPHAKNNTKALEGIAKSLGSLTGVRDVRVSPGTGSLIVHYNKTRYAEFPAELAQLGEGSDLFSLAESVQEEAEILASRSDIVRWALDSIQSMNEDLKSATGNQFDLKVLTGLVTTTVALVARAEGTPLWVTLAIFTLHSHAQLQRETPLGLRR